MGSVLLIATLIAGASFLNAENEGWSLWLVYVLLFAAVIAVAFHSRARLLVLLFLPTFIALAADNQTPPIGVGTAYAALCLAAATH